MVAILGIIAVHGRGGWVNDILTAVGGNRLDYLYGLNGILIAHVFFNLPLVTRIILSGLESIPYNQWRIAALYGFSATAIFRVIEWPVIRRLIPGACGVVFLLCFTSFAIVLALGGGPASTTLEVAIYQAVRFDFNLGKAVALSAIQVSICLILAILFFSRPPSLGLNPSDHRGSDRPDTRAPTARLTDSVVLVIAALFLISPFAGIFSGALGQSGWKIVNSEIFLRSLTTTLWISLSAGILATVLGLSIAHLIARLRQSSQHPWAGNIPEIIGMLTLLMPPITLGTGLFLLLRPIADVLSHGHLLVILINTLLTLAFTVRILTPHISTQYARFYNLSKSLGITGIPYLRRVLWPTVRQPLCYALAVATTLSAGDMGVIALFGTESLSTLPLLIYRLLGSYQLDQAAVVALALCSTCFILFWGIERIGGLSETQGRNHAGN